MSKDSATRAVIEKLIGMAERAQDPGLKLELLDAADKIMTEAQAREALDGFEIGKIQDDLDKILMTLVEGKMSLEQARLRLKENKLEVIKKSLLEN